MGHPAIDAARDERRKLERRLAADLLEFTEKTGLKITDISLSADLSQCLGEQYPVIHKYYVKVEVTFDG